MSRRELKGLDTNALIGSRLRSEHSRDRVEPTQETVPSGVMPESEEDRLTLEELQAELKRVRGELESKNDELAELKTVADTAKTELAEAKVQKESTLLAMQGKLDVARAAADEAREELEMLRESSTNRIESLESDLEGLQTHNELQRLRAIESLREEHQSRLEMEREARSKDTERMETWISDLRRSHKLETTRLMEKISMLEVSASTTVAVGAGTDVSLPTGPHLECVRASDPLTVGVATLSSSADPLLPIGSVTPASINGDPLHYYGLPSVRTSTSGDPLPYYGLPSVRTSTSGDPLPFHGLPSAASVGTSTSGDPLPYHGLPSVGTSTSGDPLPYHGLPSVGTSTCGDPLPYHGLSSAASVAVETSEVVSVLPALSTFGTPSTLSISAPPFLPTTTTSSHVASSRLSASGTVTFSTTSPRTTAMGAGPPPVTVHPPGHPATSVTPSGHRSDAPGAVVPASSEAVPLTTPDTVPTTTTDPVVQSVTRLLQAQTDAIAAQAKATAVQSLPALPHFTGEGTDVADDGFDKWIERFRERAKFAGWSESDQLYHFKLLLDKTALDVYRMLPDSDKSGIEQAIAALKQRFKPGGIEELRGLLSFTTGLKEKKPLNSLDLAFNNWEEKLFPL